MKHSNKLPEQIAAERKEAADLAKKILSLTATIPPKVVNSSGIGYAKQFKETITRVRGIAQSHRYDLGKLRQAMQDVNFYYR